MEYRQSDDQEWLENRLAFEERPENHIVVDAQPSRWYTALIPTRDHLISAVKKYDKMTMERLASEERRSKMKHPGLNADAIRWIDFDSGGLLV